MALPGGSWATPDLAADATQDAFIHAYEAIARFRGGIFRSWLLRITANASYDILRRAQRRPTTTLPDPEEGQAELPDVDAPNPVAEATRSELYRHLDLALRRSARGPARGGRAVRRVRHGLQRGGRRDLNGPGHRQIAHPSRAASTARADGRPPGTVRALRPSGPMTMQHHDHPEDERLAALAGGDPDTAGDPALREHVADVRSLLLACGRAARTADRAGRAAGCRADHARSS